MTRTSWTLLAAFALISLVGINNASLASLRLYSARGNPSNSLERPPSVPRQSKTNWAWMGRLGLGAGQSNWTEKQSGETTQTSGLWSLGEIDTEFGIRIRNSLSWSGWQLALRGSIRRQNPLDGLKFPLAWSLKAKVTYWHLNHWLRPFALISGEGFSWATPDRTQITETLPVIVRSSHLLWANFGISVEPFFWRRRVDLAFYLGRSLFASSTASNGTGALALTGWKGTAELRCKWTRHFFTSAHGEFTTLNGDAQVSGNRFGLETGMYF